MLVESNLSVKCFFSAYVNCCSHFISGLLSFVHISLGHICYAAKVLRLVQELPGLEPLTHVAWNLLTSELTIEPTKPLC